MTYWTFEEIAEHLGIAVESAQKLHWRANEMRRSDKVTDATLPEPTRYFGRTPVWDETSIRVWAAGRRFRPVSGDG